MRHCPLPSQNHHSFASPYPRVQNEGMFIFLQTGNLGWLQQDCKNFGPSWTDYKLRMTETSNWGKKEGRKRFWNQNGFNRAELPAPKRRNNTTTSNGHKHWLCESWSQCDNNRLRFHPCLIIWSHWGIPSFSIHGHLKHKVSRHSPIYIGKWG